MTETTGTVRGSKGLVWVGRVISALPVLVLLMGIGMGFSGKPEVAEGMEKSGYPARLLKPILTAALVSTVLYVIPQTSVLGAILLTGYLGGATATHVRIGEPFYMPVAVGVLVWLGLLLRERRLRPLLPLRR